MSDRDIVDTFLVEVFKQPNQQFAPYVYEAISREINLGRAESIALRSKLEDAEKRAQYAWSDGFASAEAGLAGNEAEELQRFRERECLVQQLLASWPHFTSQELYGEMLRDCMEDDDFLSWEEAFDRVRDFGPCTACAPTDAAITASTSADEHGAVAESLNNPTR